MSIINPTTFDRNIFSNNHFDAFSKEVETTQTVFKNSLDHIKSYTPYEGYDSGHIPGITSALYAPYEVYLSLTSIFKGHEQHDIEGCFDNTFRFLGIPFSTLTSLGQFFAHIGTITVVGTKLFSLIYCSIELILELLNLQRVVEFQKEMHLSLLEEIEVGLQESSPEKQLALLQKTLDHVKNTPELINYLKGKENLQAENYSDVFTHLKTHLLALDILTLKTKYFQLSSDQIQHVRKNISCSCDASKKTESEMITKALNHLLQGQKTKASRRIGAWLVQEIDTNIETLEKKIHSSNPEAGLKEAEDLLKTIKIQLQKKRMIHTFGALAYAFVIISLCASLLGAPLLLITPLLCLGMAYGVGRYVICRGFFGEKGYNFSFINLFPEALQEKYQQYLRIQETEKRLSLITYNNPAYMAGYKPKKMENYCAQLYSRSDSNSLRLLINSPLILGNKARHPSLEAP